MITNEENQFERDSAPDPMDIEIKIIVNVVQLWLFDDSNVDMETELLCYNNKGEGVESFWEDHRDFEVSVNRDHTVRWVIAPKEFGPYVHEYKLNLVSVQYKNQAFFKSDSYEVAKDGSFIKAIINSKMKKEVEESYSITFTITHQGKVSKPFIIDPKLRIKT